MIPYYVVGNRDRSKIKPDGHPRESSIIIV